MPRMRDRDSMNFDQFTQAHRQPEPPPLTNYPPVPFRDNGLAYPPVMFGSRDAFIRAMDALASEITTMDGVKVMKDKTFALYEEIDESIVTDPNPITRGRKMRWSLRAEQSLEARMERYLSRGSGITEDTLTVQSTRQDGRYR